MIGLAAWLFLGFAASQAAASDPPDAAGEAPVQSVVQAVRFHGALIRVPDLDQGISFYRDVLGFEAVRLSDDIVRLTDRTPIYLERVEHPLRPPASDEARSAIAFQTHDVEAAVSRLRSRGVIFLADAPAPVGIGLSIRFRDPFGNIHALVQQTVGESPPFEEPEVYNSGYKHPDADTAALRALFVDTLGFTIRTERYYPPSLPVGHRDGSFAFMLHENEPWESEIRPRADPDSAAVSLVFAAGELAETRTALAGSLRPGSVGQVQPFALGRRFRVVAPSGVPLELWDQQRR